MEQTILNNRGARIGKLITRSRRIEMLLTDGDLFKLEGDHRYDTIACLSGRLWVTQYGDNADYVLLPGQSLLISRAGTVIIQGQPEGRFELLPPQPGLN
jgi:hypothetical protein